MLVGAGVLGAHAYLRSVEVGLAAHEAEIASLRVASVASNRRAEALLASGRYELEALFSTRLLIAAARELGGYEQLTRRGNRFRIVDVEVHAEDGWLELVAQAEFDWRWGLYDGPIEVRYLAFATIREDGGCVLHFRVAEVKTLEHPPHFRGFLKPILVLRMQHHLRLPELELPLAVGRAAERGSGEPARGTARERAVRVTYRPAGWELGAQNPQLLLNARAFGLVVERLEPGRPNRLGGAVSEASTVSPLTFDALGEDDVRIGVRFDRLSALLASLFAPRDEVGIEIDRVPLPLDDPRSRLFGVEFERKVTLRDVRGSVDVELERMWLAGDHAEAAASFRGHFAGIVEGSFYGVDFAVPVRVRPQLEQTLPVRFAKEGEALGLFFDVESLVLDLDLEADVAGRRLGFYYPLELPASTVMRPLFLRDMAPQTVGIPTRVERGRILERRPLQLAVDWSFRLPEREDQLLWISGRARFGSAADGFVQGSPAAVR